MRLAAVGVLMLLAAAPASASAADVMVVGRTDTLVAPRTASTKGARVTVDGRRCRVAARTALAALARTSLKLGLRDYGACGDRAADAGGLYVRSVAGERERASDGWVYKVDDQAPSIGAGDPAGRFGPRARVLWFWCRGGATGCQRTLSVAPSRRTVERGEPLRVTVRAFDDLGRAVAGAGARVTLGSTIAVADARGVAVLPTDAETGTLGVMATRAGSIRSFPAAVTVR